jgi:hypothetical protein
MRHVFILLIALYFIGNESCSYKKNSAPQVQAKQVAKSNDPLCGDSVIWHVHFQAGFNNDTVVMIVGSDTLDKLIIRSGDNGCSNVQVSMYRQYEKNKIFLDNSPAFTMIQELDYNIKPDSIKMELIINSEKIHFSEWVKYDKYFGLNLQKDPTAIVYRRSDRCFICM